MTFLQIGLLRPSVQLIPSPPKSRGTFADRCRASGLEALPTIGAGTPGKPNRSTGRASVSTLASLAIPDSGMPDRDGFRPFPRKETVAFSSFIFGFSFLSFAPGTRRVHDYVPAGKPMRDWTKTDAELRGPAPVPFRKRERKGPSSERFSSTETCRKTHARGRRGMIGS